MNEIISFWVPGIPAPGGSKKAFPIKKGGKYTGRVAVVDAGGQKTKDWRANVTASAFEAMQKAQLSPLEGPLAAEVYFVMPRPLYHFKKSELRDDAPVYHTKAPDATKLMRSTEDSLKGIVFRDDAQICSQLITKVYGEKPGCSITISCTSFTYLKK